MADDITDMLKEVGILTKLVKSLKTSNETLKNVKGSGGKNVKPAEKKNTLDKEFKKRDEGIVVKGFSNAAIDQLKVIAPAAGGGNMQTAPTKKSGGLMDGILAVVGVGLGVAGLLGAMAGVDALASAIGTGDSLKSLMTNLAEGLGAFSGPSMVALGALLGAGAIFGVVGGMGTSFKVAVGMTAIGAGLGGFFAGLALADAGAGFLNSDGSTIKALMVNLAEGLGAFSGPSMVALTVLLGAGALFGAVGGPAVAGMAALGMSAIGLGLGGFFAGLAVADKGISLMMGDGQPGESIKFLMVNMGEGLGGLFGGVKDVTLADITKLPLAAAAAASSMIAIAGGSGIAAILGGLTKVVNFFSGGTNPMDFVIEIGERADEVDAGATAINNVAEALKKLSGFDVTIKSNFEDFADDLKKSVPIIEAAINGDDGGWFGSEIKGINSKDVNYYEAARRMKTLRGAVSGNINVGGASETGQRKGIEMSQNISTNIKLLNQELQDRVGESNKLLVENNRLLDLILRKEPSNQPMPSPPPPSNEKQATNFDQSGDTFRQLQSV